ncbi:AAA family ATPase [Paenibacillus borealis]|uniref:AAA family ATPase n=1 Tax=Paenibacillus borealis TaxID=160799 RepID=UPI0015C2E739|nr:AAA family ATPase [Paenibacillus borealis]
MYFSNQTFRTYYQMLQPRDRGGKLGRETTSGLAYFFSLDRLQRTLGSEIIDLHPESEERHEFIDMFVETLLIGFDEDNRELQASNLGFVEIVENSLEKKVSSNFLTVPVKKGSRQQDLLPYPGRPGPLVNLGVLTTTHDKWGITKNPDWKENFPKFINRRICGEDTFPLIVFLLRDKALVNLESNDAQVILESSLKDFITDETAEFLVSLAEVPEEWGTANFFSENYVPLADYTEFIDSLPQEEIAVAADTEVLPIASPPFEINSALTKKIEAAIRAGSHIILTGPPGTGKTTIAKAISANFKGADGYKTYTATSNWTAFEVLGGYLPDPSDPQRLQFEEGFITRSIAENQWVIIDEINRADVDKAFGELFTVLTGNSVHLPYYKFVSEQDGTIKRKKITIMPESERVLSEDNQENYFVQADWRIIGTMNTFDKSSLYQLSYAFMRRFAFIEVEPPSSAGMEEILGQKINQMQINEEVKEEVKVYLIKLFAVGLYSIKYEVGVAIPISIINYLEKRIGNIGELEEPIGEIIIEAISMYLFPQFEGRRRDFDSLLQVIVSSLDIEEPVLKSSLIKELTNWTGNIG